MNRGSEVHILCDKSLSERLRDFKESGFDPNDLENISLIHFEGTPCRSITNSSYPVYSFESLTGDIHPFPIQVIPQYDVIWRWWRSNNIQGSESRFVYLNTCDTLNSDFFPFYSGLILSEEKLENDIIASDNLCLSTLLLLRYWSLTSFTCKLAYPYFISI